MNAVESNETGNRPAFPPWLAAHMLRRGGSALSRFAAYYCKLAALPRPWRRRLRRKLAVTFTSAALLLALTAPTAYLGASQTDATSVIPVADGVVEIAADGQCSLIEAIVNAQATRPRQLHADCAAGNLSGPDTIVLPEGGNFTLTQAYDYQYNGLPPISGVVTIEGNGATIENGYSWNLSIRILEVTRSGDLTLRNTTISGGYLGSYSPEQNGAGILNNGRLALDQCVISHNTSYDGAGGGIANFGSLTVERSTLSNNWGPWGDNAWRDDLGGGAIANFGEGTIRDTTISDNWAYANGGAITNFGDRLTISGSLFTGNGACQTSAIANQRGKMVFTNTTISGNLHLCCQEGCFDRTESQTIENSGTLTLNNSTVANNNLYFPAAIWNHGTLILNRSIVSSNEGECYDSNNYAYPCDRTLANDGTVIANNFNVFGTGGNAGMVGARPGRKDVVPAGPLPSIIRPLDFHAGPTLTHTLPPGSPAIDLAPDGDCGPGPVNSLDQRGQPRSSDGNGMTSPNECDAGAVEMQPVEFERAVLLTTAAGGTTADGLRFRVSDILKWDGAAWSKFFDGRSVGLPLTADIAAISIPLAVEPDIYLSFATSLRLPGVGIVRPHDVVRWNGARFSLLFDGSDVGLAGRGERIDALEVLPQPGGSSFRLLLSTTGNGAVDAYDTSTGELLPIKFRGEDILAIMVSQTGPDTAGQWEFSIQCPEGEDCYSGPTLDGSFEGMPLNSTFSLASALEWDPVSMGPAYGPRPGSLAFYLSSKGPFVLDDASGTHSMVFKGQWARDPGSYGYWDGSYWFSGPYFKAADHDLFRKVDGLEVLGDLP